jgi:predicted HTH domain antitoxin
MKSMTVKVPENFAMNEQELSFFLAAKLYEQRMLSMGRAAEMAGVDKRTFIENVGKYEVSIFNYTKEELELEFKYAKNIDL